MRDEFSRVLRELMRKDPKIHLLSMDAGENTFLNLKNEFPSKYLNTGVSEQAIVGMASGMALEGLKPYVYSITPFILERPFEQVKLDLVEQKANVKLVGYWDYPTAGPTHFTKDPRGLCKILGIEFIEPENSEETKIELIKEYGQIRPAFFYLKKK